MKTSISCLFCILIYFCCSAQENATEYLYMGSIPIPKDRGGNPCYTRYIAPEVYEIQTNRYPIYTGDEATEEVSIHTKSIQTSAPKAEWVKQSDTADPDKYYAVYTLIPGVFEEIKILLDTTQSDNYVIMDIDEEVLIHKKGREEFIEVVCGAQFNEKLIIMLQNALGLKGYYTGPISKKMDPETRNALSEYQKDNSLKVGSMELETFRFLGIVY